MNKKYNLIFFFSVILIWAVFAAVNVFKPQRGFSENENRELSQFPEMSVERVLKSEFMKEFDSYANDQFLFRDEWVSVYYRLEYARNMREINGVYICGDSLISNIDEPDPECVSVNVGAINLLAEKFPDKNVYVMIVPSAAEVQRDKLPLFASSWDQKSAIDDIYSKITGGNVKRLDVLSVLSDHKDEYIYYRTDHHWTTYGASLACDEFRAAAGLGNGVYDFETVTDDFNGTVYSKIGVKVVTPDEIEAVKVPEDAICTVYRGKNGTDYPYVYFEEFLEEKDKYSYFLGTNQAVVRISTGSGTGKKLLMFKDSYSHCFAPMLLGEYSEILLVDTRYLSLQIGVFADLSEYDDVLFLYSMDGFASQDSLKRMNFFLSPVKTEKNGDNDE